MDFRSEKKETNEKGDILFSGKGLDVPAVAKRLKRILTEHTRTTL
jgi:hypothetical protein